MLIHLHSQATTTPKVRAAIQASDEPASALAERFPKEGGYSRPDAAQLEPEQVGDIVEELTRLGYNDDAIGKMVGGNWLRIMTNVWK